MEQYQSPYQTPPPPPRRAGPSTAGTLLLLLVVIGIGCLLGYRLWVANDDDPLHDPSARPRAITPRGDLAADEKTNTEIYSVAAGSVVHISTSKIQRDFFNRSPLETPEGTGSGFVWDDNGHIVTNFHVIENANRILVRLEDLTQVYEAKMVGMAPNQDLAVLKIAAPREHLLAIEVGTSEDLKVGQNVFAIGSPFGLDKSMSRGIISALDREIRPKNGRVIREVIQTDAAINPGNSGGPLLDSAGRLIGVNTAIYSRSGSYAGIGFAIPVDTVNRIVPQLIRTGEVRRAGLGIQTYRDRAAGGMLVMKVYAGTAAEAAGLRQTEIRADGSVLYGDVIIEADGTKVRTLNDLHTVLEEHDVNDTITIKVIRGFRTPQQQEMDLAVTLQELPTELP